MKEKLLEILEQSDKALSVFEIEKLFNFHTAEDLRALTACLALLEKEMLVYHTNKDRYMLLSKSHLKKGQLRANKKGFGFVQVEGMADDIYISQDNMNNAIHDDIVLVELLTKEDAPRLEGRILRVLKRDIQTVIGEITFIDDVGFLDLDNDKIKINVEIPRRKALNAVDGHKVLVKIIGSTGKNKYRGEVIKILGHKNDPGVDILSIVYKYNINDVFPDDVINEVVNLPLEVKEEEMVGRRDLTSKMIYTIDGDDTKDIDDAISLEVLANGNYLLGVHIADVSHYVKENSPLDIEAMERGTSVYLVDRVIPMLPHELSNGICSLNEDVKRLAISCVMEIDKNAKIVNYEIFESVIKSRKQMTYTNVNKIIEDNEIPVGYEEYADNIKLMDELSKILRSAKLKRGYLDFDVDEAKIIVDEKCHPIDITTRVRGRGENIIEDFMIIANECIATHIYYMDLPFLYRVHDIPKEEKIRSYMTFLGTLGYNMNLNLKEITPLSVQKVLNFIKDKEEAPILSSLLLRNMQKAVYRPENLGHFGLASKCYTHFTSPIRRYPDTTVHRLLHTYLFEHDLTKDTIKHWTEKLVFVGEQSSRKEKASIDCEREVKDMKMAEYMEDHIGEEFSGIIVSILSFGMFVQLDNLIEGLVPIKDMKDFFHYNEDAMTLTGERTGIVYKMGQRINVKVIKASKEDKTIDFEIVKTIK
ncbi:MAG: ribonuclease R [Bacilli bacterium]